MRGSETSRNGPFQSIALHEMVAVQQMAWLTTTRRTTRRTTRHSARVSHSSTIARLAAAASRKK
jgi:hypothetical protein